MEDEKLIDQSQLAESVSDKIPYEMHRHFLIKPLDPIKVKKEFSKPVATDNTPKTDENGVEAVDYDKVETEVKEVDSDFRKGVILKIPFDYQQSMDKEKDWMDMPMKVGDVVVYQTRGAVWFDLLKDTQLIPGYDIIAVETVNA